MYTTKYNFYVKISKLYPKHPTMPSDKKNTASSYYDAAAYQICNSCIHTLQVYQLYRMAVFQKIAKRV